MKIKGDATLQAMVKQFKANDGKISQSEAAQLAEQALRDGKVTAAERKVLAAGARAPLLFEKSDFTPAARAELKRALKSDTAVLSTRIDRALKDGAVSAAEVNKLLSQSYANGLSLNDRQQLAELAKDPRLTSEAQAVLKAALGSTTGDAAPPVKLA